MSNLVTGWQIICGRIITPIVLSGVYSATPLFPGNEHPQILHRMAWVTSFSGRAGSTGRHRIEIRMMDGCKQSLMLIRDIDDARYFPSHDGCTLCELLHPKNDPDIDMDASLCHAYLQPGKATVPHCLKHQSEVYYVLSGEGELVFLAICSPQWAGCDEEILDSSDNSEIR